MKQKSIPLWSKKGMLIWVEIKDKSGHEVQEFLEAEISQVNHDEQILKIKYQGKDSEEDVDPCLIFERLPEHGIVEDLADIPVLNDAELLKHLEIRYNHDHIHCFCGPTLVVINPYKRIEHEESLKTWDLVHRHLKQNNLNECIPHLWTISARCWDNLFKTDTNQAICISGESGAGKTESTKRCMAFLTKMNHTRSSTLHIPIEDKILACNPLLEAFGNAKTFRNDNSSRFGKYTILYINKELKKVKGASIENYLLEKSRICQLNKEERNYHIFYSMCRFMPKDMLKKYKLQNDGDKCDMSKFQYLNQSGVYQVDKINDEEFYDDVEKAFMELNFSNDEQDCIWRNLASILYLGNLKIDQSDFQEGQSSCQIEKDQSWHNIIELLEIDENLFENALTHKEIKVGASVTRSPLQPSKVKNNIDSMAKEIYNRMFSWIILKLNKTLLPRENLSQFGTIGILDIFGFEIFEKNSLEQFFINFANERLQSLYIEYIFKNECRIFEEEGLAEYTSLIVYTDNKPIVNALEFEKMPPGIFNLIDQSSLMNQTDEKLHSEIKTQHNNSQVVSFPRVAKSLAFIVKHTAREVEYLTDGFVDKNKDELSPFLKQAIGTSYQTIVDIFEMTQGLDIDKTISDQQRINPKEKFLGYKFRRDMANLLDQLISCDCQFIRCIKPNELKKSGLWSGQLALMQIQYMGMLDSLKVRKQSYPYRFTFSKFYNHYQDLDTGENGRKKISVLTRNGANFEHLSKSIFTYVEQKPTPKDVLYGSTRIFLQESYKIYLDKILMVKQKKKRDALQVIMKIYCQYEKRNKVREYFKTQSNSFQIARDLLGSFQAKLEGMKFKRILRMVNTIQIRFHYRNNKKEIAKKLENMILIQKYLNMYKFSNIFNFILYHKRKLQTLQALLDSKIRESKIKYCREFIDDIFQQCWSQVKGQMVHKSVVQLQSSIRGMILRKKKQNQYLQFQKVMQNQLTFDYSSTIQKHIKSFIVKKRMKKLNQAAFRIQRYLRTKWMREYFLRLQRANKVLQKWFFKMHIRQNQLKDKLKEFLDEHQPKNEFISEFENCLLFGDENKIEKMKDSSIYNSVFDHSDFKGNNFKDFIPVAPEIEVQPKIKLFSLIVDMEVTLNSLDSYPKTWAQEFIDFIKQDSNKRFLSIEIGDNFTMAVNSDREIYSWGLNDVNQCAQFSFGFNCSQKLVKNLSCNNARLISLGKDHGVMVNDSNQIFIWGNQGESQNPNTIIVQNFKEKIQQISSQESKNYLLGESGTVYHFLNDEFKPTPLKFNTQIQIIQMSLGSNFAQFLSSKGLLYSHGENLFGELGYESEYQHTPQLVSFLADKNEKIIEISSGYKHVICKTSLQKVFSWGLNNKGQLGLEDKQNRWYPERVKITLQKYRPYIRSVQAGFHSSFILLNNRNIYYMGKCGSQKSQLKPMRFNYEKNFDSSRITDNFTPVKIFTKSSKMLNCTYIVFADFRNTRITTQNREKIVDQLNQEWLANNQQIIPYSSTNLAKNIDSKFLISTNRKPKLNTKFRGEFVVTEKKNYQEEQQNIDEQTMGQLMETRKPTLFTVEEELTNTQISTNTLKSIEKSQKTLTSTKKTPKSKTPLKKPPNHKISKELWNHITQIMSKDPSKLTTQEKQVLKIYNNTFK